MRSLVAIAALAALLSAGVSPALAQSGTASLTGRITDQQDAVLPGSSVTLTNTNTGISRSAATNESGIYQFSALPPGRYEMKVELTGFRSAQLTGIELRVDTQSREDVKLALGPVTESVSVQAESPLINTTDASLGNTLNEEAIRNLPVEARNVVQLLSLQPGVTFIPTNNPQTADPRYGASAGARSDQQNVTLDGIDVNDPQLGSSPTSTALARRTPSTPLARPPHTISWTTSRGSKARTTSRPAPTCGSRAFLPPARAGRSCRQR